MVTNDFVELLEVLATERKRCEIIFLDDGGRISMNQRIEGVYDRGDFQVIQIESGKEIPLDKLVSVDGFSAESIG